jgi:endonuclease/exonuclease/phosphatase family metal-dependent hydrolase
MIKLISVNIEAHKHLDLIIDFLQREQPDVVNMQEVFEVDMPRLIEATGMWGKYVGTTNVDEPSIHNPDVLGSMGIAQLSRLPVVAEGADFYYLHNNEERLPKFFDHANPNSIHRAVSWLRVGEYTIATTHFTWSPEGSFTPLQQENMAEMLKVLDQMGEFVFTGDFNSPRQGEGDNVFHTLARKYQDNIPAEVTTSIDGQFHKAGALELMVDGVFSTPEYRVSEVRMVNGVSDHLAVVAMVERVG